MKRVIRAFLATVLLCASAAFAQSGSAPGAGGPQAANAQAERQQAQPGNNAPVWREVRSGATHYTSLPGRETGVLIQTEGEDWRQLRPSIYSVGGVAMAAMLAILMAFYAVRGPIKVQQPATGRFIRRFSTAERIAHWTVGITFVILALTGLVITFGKYVLLPVIGYTLFGWLATFTKNVHNFVGPVFAVALPVFIVMYVRDNLLDAVDFKWISSLGGLRSPSGEHLPSGRFNVPEKAYFWGMVCVVCLTLAVSGLVLDFPNFEQTRGQMQLANTVHLIASMIGMFMALGHIYLGTIGHKAAFEGMRYGYVDESWAREHHGAWYEDVKAGRAREKFADPDEAIPDPVRVAARAQSE